MLDTYSKAKAAKIWRCDRFKPYDTTAFVHARLLLLLSALLRAYTELLFHIVCR